MIVKDKTVLFVELIAFQAIPPRIHQTNFLKSSG